MTLIDPRTLRRITAALSARPELVLVFAVCTLVATLAAGAQLFVDKEQQLPLFALAGAFLIGALVAGARVFRDVTQSSFEPHRESEAAPATEAPFAGAMASTAQSLGRAQRIDNPVFLEEVTLALDDLRSRAEDWARGKLIAPEERYNRVLLKLYESATTSVFSTTIPDYLETWNSPLGDQLLEAHQRSTAGVTRVFVFNERSELTDAAVTLMRRHEDAGVRVLVYIDREDPGFSFSPDVSRDFTIIDDGRAIGVTVSYGRALQAEWYFDDNARKGRFRDIRESLLRGCRRLEQLLDRQV